MENQDGDGCSGLMDNVFCQGCSCNYDHSRDDVKSRFDGLISDKQEFPALSIPPAALQRLSGFLAWPPAAI